jgi:hypothetical protein
MTTDIDLPDVRAEIDALFARYERALVTNDTETLDALFWDSPQTVRYGATENLYGIEAIREFRRARSSAGLQRTVPRAVVTTFGRDFATTCIEFQRTGSSLVGRQTQSWVRLPEGFRIVAAHVSVVDLGSVS